MSGLLDLTSVETVTALSIWHAQQHIIELVEQVGSGMGLAWFLLMPLGAGAIPTIFHFMYRTGTFFSATYDTNSKWFGTAW